MEYNISTTELSKHINKNKQTIDYWRNNKKVSFEKRGREFWFNLEEVLSYIEKKSKKKELNGFVCHICGEQTKYNTWSTFSKHHLNKHNITSKEYYDKFLANEEERFCKVCGKEKAFICPSNGYKKYCSDPKCRGSDPQIKNKIFNSKMKKYGDGNYVNREKAMNTNLKSHGKKHYTNREKSKKTVLEKYNAENIMHVESFKEKHLLKKALKKIDYYSELLRDKGVEPIVLKDQVLTSKCTKCNELFDIHTKLLYTRLRDNIPICTKCFPVNDIKVESSGEKELQYFLESIIEDTIVVKDRKILEGKELDILIPNRRLAFEFNGLYWHCDQKKHKNYHLEKTELCEKKGIRLIHIFEDTWKDNKNLLKSMIKNILNLNNNKIFARKCELDFNVTQNDYSLFYEQNHIQGTIYNHKTIGLKYNDEYVCMMSFSKNRHKEFDYELTRFCNKKDFNVVGGATKLFKNFIKENNVSSIVSYVDRTWSIGDLYHKLEFEHIYNSKPSYFYYDLKERIRINRFSLRKEKLKEMGFEIDNKTEFDIINENLDLLRIFNCGHMKFIWRNHAYQL